MKPLDRLRVTIFGNFPTYQNAQELGISATANQRVTSWNETLVDALAELDDIKVHVITRYKGKRTVNVKKGSTAITFLAASKVWNGATLFGYTALQANQVIKSIQPDIVHGIGTEHIWPTAALMSGYPTIVTVHGVMNNIVKIVNFPILSRNRWLYQWFAYLERRILGRIEHLISISPYVVDSLGQYTKAMIHSIENPIANRFFNKHAQPGQARKIIFVGDTGQRKSLLTLLIAFSELKEAGLVDDWQIAIIGPTSKEPYHGKVMAYIEERQLNDHVVFKGFMLPDELADEYQTSALLALSSIEETAPMCIAEAMAVGLPVVATRIAGVPYMVSDNQTGFLCEVNQPLKMAEHLRSLVTSPGLRDEMGKRAKKEAQERWSPKTIAVQTLNAYRAVLGMN